MIYCDTSLLVTALSGEAAAGAAQLWLSQQDEGELGISGWVVTEFASALSSKLRTKQLNVEDKIAVSARWAKLRDDSLLMLPVPQEAFALAARFCDMKDSTLRAGDALHLAVAALGGHALATLDERMRAGAEAVGVRVVEFDLGS